MINDQIQLQKGRRRPRTNPWAPLLFPVVKLACLSALRFWHSEQYCFSEGGAAVVGIIDFEPRGQGGKTW